MAEEAFKAKVPSESKPVRDRKDDNVIFVGRKPSMAYVLGVITQFNDGRSEVHIKARGKSISRAVDVAEIVRRRFISDAQIRSIDIGTEERELEDKSKINVSTIEIVLGK
jgi:DNA-binding protein